MDLTTFMRTPAITCSADTPVRDVSMLMRDAGTGTVLITDQHGHVQGIVTDRDLVTRGMAHGCEARTPVSDVMTKTVHYLYADQDVTDATTMMVEHGVRRLPVLSNDGDGVLGVVALDDLFQGFARQLDVLATVAGKVHPADLSPIPEVVLDQPEPSTT